MPDEIRTVLAAYWFRGCASLEWLIEHPEWAYWVDICSIAVPQAQAERTRRNNPPT